MEPLLTTAVKNALRVRFMLGEFDAPPSGIPQSWEEASSGHSELALEAAQQGAVLLKNAGSLLPLSVDRSIAVLGPLRNGTLELLGNYEAWPVPVVSPLEGLQKYGEKVEAPGPEVDLCGANPGTMPAKPDAEVVVIVAGLSGDSLEVDDPDVRPVELDTCIGGCMEGEGCDRPNISWPASQKALIQTAVSWGVPVVLVIVSAGPLDLAAYAETEGISAILWLGYAGEAAGDALGRLVFGLASPSGRLPHTFYRSEYLEHLPMQDYTFRARPAEAYPGRGYRFVADDWIVYPFGHGLSYDSFSYEWLGQVALEGKRQVGLKVKLAKRGAPLAPSASIAVLFFLRPPPAKAAGLRKRLVDFRRVEFPATLAEQDCWSELWLELSVSDFELVDEAGARSVASGTWTLEVNQGDLTRQVAVDASGFLAKTILTVWP